MRNLVQFEPNTTGPWLSEIVETPLFKRLVVSWNAKTYPETSVEVWIRVRCLGQWSMWFSYGKWTTDGQNTGSFSGQADALAKLQIDELVVLNGNSGDAIQLKAEQSTIDSGLLSPDDPVQLPFLKRLFVSLDTTQKPESLNNLPTKSFNLSVSPRAQLSIEDIGNRICSPTSVAMVMAYYGHDLPTKVVAQGTLDNGTSIYGNWSYNMAYAGEGPFIAYASYCDSFSEIIHFLEMGQPLVASIVLKDPAELEGATQAYPSGHLIVLTGFEVTPVETYILVHDPAAYTQETVPRRYRLDQFLKVWKNLVYHIYPEDMALDRSQII